MNETKKITEENKTEDRIFPVVPVRDSVVYPNTESTFIFARAKTIMALQAAIEHDGKAVFVMQINNKQNDPKIDEIHTIGTLVNIEKSNRGERGELNVLVKGIERVSIVNFTQIEPFFIATVASLPDSFYVDDEIEAMVKYIATQIKKAISYGKSVDFVFLMGILNMTSAVDFSYQVGMIVDASPEEHQLILAETDIKKRLTLEIKLIDKEIKLLEIERKIIDETNRKFNKEMRDSFLREKIRTIEKELGHKDDEREITEYKEKIVKAKMPEEVEKKARKELKKLSGMSPYNPEASYIRNYLDWLVELPWSIKLESEIDIKKAEDQLNKDHYGLKKVKERIIEYLAVMQLHKQNEEKNNLDDNKIKSKKQIKPPAILCFAGPPGVGKTSLGRSIASAMGREFVKISLGGIRDEAEIRGHRRTYVGAMPGRIIQAIKQAKSNNPVFILDEIDKIGNDYRGDPSAALLEALDPEQNFAFSDHYLEVDFDLSNVFFITTANVLETIPDALMDRLEVIQFSGYTEDEKFFIVKNYLIDKQLKAHSETVEQVQFTDEALRVIIRRYTREAGVRNLERNVATIMRKIAKEIVSGEIKSRKVDKKMVSKYLGPFRYPENVIEDKDGIGIATGLAWTQVGGDILFIEVAIMPGKGNLNITGQLGDVMKESCHAALSYLRSRWEKFNLKKDFFSNLDIHVHVPEGSVPKDGPSAGIAITTAILSALSKRPVNRELAMTGEVTLRGRVMEIGGVKEKVIAAHRSGIKQVILPYENKKDLDDVPHNVKKDLKFTYVKHMDEVINLVFGEFKVSKTKE